MALLGGSWRLICMAGWCNYYYCFSCGRPYCQSETKKGGWVVTSDTGSGFHSVHCMSCSKMIHQPGLLPTILLWVVCVGASPVSFARWISSGEQIELMITVFCGVGGLLGLRTTLKSSSKYKPIYDRWVQKHGSAPDDWPTPTKYKYD